MRTPFNPYGGVNPLIDKMIGNAYDIVKYVARYLKEIRYVAENMEHVYDAVHGYRHHVEAWSQGYTTLTFQMPNSVSIESVTSIESVAINGGSVYLPGPDTYNLGVDYGTIVISINPNAPSNLRYALFRVTFNTLLPSQTIHSEE